MRMQCCVQDCCSPMCSVERLESNKTQGLGLARGLAGSVAESGVPKLPQSSVVVEKCAKVTVSVSLDSNLSLNQAHYPF